MKTIKATIAFNASVSIEVDENSSNKETIEKLKSIGCSVILDQVSPGWGIIIDCSDPSLVEADLTV